MSIINSIRETVKKAWLIGDAMMNEPKVQEEEARLRLKICRGCPQFSSLTQQCGVCGCFMMIKTKLLYDPVESEKQGEAVLTKCPNGLW